MRKLSWFLIAIVLATYTIHLWATADPTATYVLRDGCLLALLALFIIAWQAPPLDASMAPLQPIKQSNRTPTAVATELTATGGVLLGTAIACLFAGAVLPNFLATVVATRSAEILRGLGWGLLLIATIWPRAWQRRWHTANANVEHSAPPIRPKMQRVSPATVPWPSLLFLLLLNSGLRFLLFNRLPVACVGAECEAALALNGTIPGTMAARPWLQLLFHLSGDSLQAVRLGALLIALVIPLFFYLALRALTNNGAALLGALLLTLTPWFATLDSSALATLMTLFWSCGALWLLLAALRSGDPRWALPAGVVLALCTDNGLVQVALLLWLLLLVLFTLFAAQAGGQHRDTRARLTTSLLLVSYLATALPNLLQTLFQQTGALAPMLSTAGANAFTGTSFLFTLLQQSPLTTSYWQNVPPLAMPASVLALLGLGLYLRSLRTVSAFALGSATLICGLLLFYSGTPDALPLLFLFLIFTAALALTTLLASFYQLWQPLLPYANLVATTALLIVLLAAKPLLAGLGQGTGIRSQEALVVEQLMIEQIAALRAEDPGRTIFAPTTLLQNPSARLRLGDKILATIHPLSDLLNTLYTADEVHTTTYFIPVTAQPYLELIQRLQPGATVSQQIEPTSGDWLYSEVTVPQADQLAHQGLQGIAWEERPTGSGTPLMLPPLGPLAFDGGDLTLVSPYTLQWSGSLRVAVPGRYRIVLDTTSGEGQWLSGDHTLAILTLQLDNRLILDSSLGLLDQEIDLVKGFYQLSLRYWSPPSEDQASTAASPTAVPPFAIRWQRPDGVDEFIPRAVLSDLPRPNVGLIGAYYWGDSIAGEPFDLRKDLLVGAVAERGEPYSIRWQGQLAAPRSGEYLLSTLSAPGSATQLTLDGIQLLDTAQLTAETGDEPAPGANSVADTLYGEGTIYLTRGWHAIELVHRPDAAQTPLQLLWQPPGSAPTMLDNDFLAPVLTPLAEVDRPLPSAPPLVNGTDHQNFALSYGTEFWHPQRQIPPGLLPQLALDRQWQLQSCGSDETALDQPHGVAISSVRGLIYVVDTANRRVVEYTLAGAVSRIYSSPQWEEPFAVALIDDGFPVVLDATTQLLYDLNPATGDVTTRPQHTSFYHPRGLATDNMSNLLVADTGGGRIVQLSPGGDELRSFGGQGTPIARGQPTGVAGAGGALWAVTPEDGRLWQLESGGSITVLERTNTLNGPHLAALPSGQLFLTDPTRRLLLYLAPTGEPLGQMVLSDFVAPTGVAATTIDNQLYLVIADSANCSVGLWRAPLAALPQPTP